MHAVGAAHLQRPGVLAGPGHDGGDGLVECRQDEVSGRPALEREAGVDDIAAGEPEVDPATLLPDALGDLRDEGHHVMVGGGLDLVDALEIDGRARLHRRQRLRRHPARIGQCLQDGDLDTQHVFEAAGVRPQRPHLRGRVASDHGQARGRWWKG